MAGFVMIAHKKKMCAMFIFLALTALAQSPLFSQTTIWFEDFEDLTQGDVTDAGATAWTMACSGGSPCGLGDANTNDYFEVRNSTATNGARNLHGRDMDNELRWTSEWIQVGGYSNVSGSAILYETSGDDANDYVEFYYSLNAGPEVAFTNGIQSGNFGQVTATFSGLIGDSIQIIGYFRNNANNDRIGADDITVTGVLIGKDGPGGIGDTDGSGTLSFWIDANQGVTTTGTAVTQWDDQSGYGNHAAPAAVANRPTYNASGTNNHPTVTFDGTDDYLTAPDDNSLDFSTFTIVVVGIVNTHKNYNAFVVKGSDSQENYEFLTNFPGTGNFHYPMRHSGGAGRSVNAEPGSTMSTSVYGVYQLDFDQNNFEFHINGTQTETDPETRGAQTNTDALYIGNEQGTTGRQIDATVAEIVMYSSPLSTAQRLILHNAMSAKYDFSMSANDLYDQDDALNGDFDYDVAGIGRATDGSRHLDAEGTGIVRIRSASDLANGEYFIWGHDNEPLSSFGETDLPTGVEARLSREWRPSETGEVGTVTISFDLSTVFGSKTASDLRLLIDTDNDGMFSDETASGVIAGAVNTSGDIFEWTGIDIDDNQRFTVGSINFSQTPLPITLVSFEATPTSNGDVALHWATSSEINNDYFTIERSVDAEQWEVVRTIEGAGNSSTHLRYAELDEDPHFGVSYYRLRQTDFDGTYSYSHTEAIEIMTPSSIEDLKVYPNPSNGKFNIEFTTPKEGQANLHVYNTLGNLVHSGSMEIHSGANKVQLNLQHLDPGQYFIRMVTSSGEAVQRSIVVN